MSDEVSGETAQGAPSARSRRGLFHGRQRLLWSLALAGAAVVGIAILTYNARRQAGAVAAIRALGGKVSYGDELPFATTWWPRWIGRRLGHDFVSDVVVLKLGGAGLRDSDLTCLAPLSRLLEVHITDAAVTDAGLSCLRNKSSLETLSLRGIHVGDDALAHLKGLTGLKFLNLQGTNVSDAGLHAIKGLPGLRGVNLMGTRVSAEAAAQLRNDRTDIFVQR